MTSEQKDVVVEVEDTNAIAVGAVVSDNEIAVKAIAVTETNLDHQDDKLDDKHDTVVKNKSEGSSNEIDKKEQQRPKSDEQKADEDSPPSPTVKSFQNRPLSSHKTLYLIRHAETLENTKISALKNAATMLTKCRRPRKEDVTKSLGLIKDAAVNHADSPLSEFGKKQVENMGSILREGDFLREESIELVVHSPLSRARESCAGILNCCAVATSTEGDDGVLIEKCQPPPNYVKSGVIELECLKEATPHEQLLPGGKKKFMERLDEFELWLGGRKEERIAVVGHSQYFRTMLGMKKKFNNCDVWRVTYSPSKNAKDDDLAHSEMLEMRKSNEQLNVKGDKGSEKNNDENDLHFHTSKTCRWINPILLFQIDENLVP